MPEEVLAPPTQGARKGKQTRLQMVQQLVPNVTRSGSSRTNWQGCVGRWFVYFCALSAKTDGRGRSCTIRYSERLTYFDTGPTAAEAFANAKARAFAVAGIISDLQETT